MATRLAGAGDLGEIERVLLAAFADDPIFRWMFPSADRFDEHLGGWLRLVVGHLVGFEETYLDERGAVVSWTPPGAVFPTDDAVGEAAALLERTGEGRAGAVLPRLAAAGAHRPSDPPSYDLFYIGVVPELQGRGVGRDLVQPQLDRADRDGVGAYLHSTNPRNVPFYERLGFRVLAEVPVADDGGPVIRPMWRDPPG